MTELALAKKYARALFEVSEKVPLGNESSIYNDLKYILSCIYSNEKLKNIWFDKRISKVDKKAMLNKILEKKTLNVSVKFLEFIIDKKREGIFKEIVEAYYQLFMESQNVLDVEVKQVAK